MDEPLVFVVDDDPSVRRSLERLIRSFAMDVELFASAEEFLRRRPPHRPSCVVLDLRMPGLSGLELQRDMVARGMEMPVVFITGHGTVPDSVQAMKAGAVDFLEKPFEAHDLLSAIRQSLDDDARGRRAREKLAELRSRAATLTKRESEVFLLVVDGLLNKQVAGKLGISEKTVKVHRGRVVAKMKADSIAHLVRMAEMLRRDELD